MSKRAIKRSCIECGEEFIINVGIQEYMEQHGFELPRRCPECRAMRKAISKEITCIDCGMKFHMNANEIKFYGERGLDEPKRCIECRRLKNENSRSQDINHHKAQ
jgi:hypothetical protein